MPQCSASYQNQGQIWADQVLKCDPCSQLCKVHYLRIADLYDRRSKGVCAFGM